MDTGTNIMETMTYENCPIFKANNLINFPYKIAGKTYNNSEELISAIKTMIWCTYRSGFPVLQAENQDNSSNGNQQTSESSSFQNYMSSYTSDSGWGCAVRVGQMLLAETYQRLLSENQRNELISRFLDNQNEGSPFSFHNFVLSFARSDPNYKIGTWLGPNNVCHCIKKLVGATTPDMGLPKLNTFVCMDSTIVIPELPTFSNILDFTTETSVVNSEEVTPLLLLIPLRLGLEKIYTDTYKSSILTALSIEYSVGFIGGRPRSAYYFFGYSEDSEELLCLDPHTVQSYHGNTLKENSIDEYSCSNPLVLSGVENLDPSLAMGFLCKNQNELDDLISQLEKLNLVAIMKSLPDFGFPEDDSMENSNDSICGVRPSMGNGDEFDMPDSDDDFEILECSRRELDKEQDNMERDLFGDNLERQRSGDSVKSGKEKEE